MPVIQRKLKDGELDMRQEIDERIRVLCGESRENFYGNPEAGEAGVIQHGGSGLELVRGFMRGLWIGCHGET